MFGHCCFLATFVDAGQRWRDAFLYRDRAQVCCFVALSSREPVTIPGRARGNALGVSCASVRKPKEKPAQSSRLPYRDNEKTDYFFSIAPLSLFVSFFIFDFFFILFIEFIDPLSVVAELVALV
jgi:hypothetical protein